MYFHRNLRQSVVTILVTSNFDGYNDFKPRYSFHRHMALSYTCLKQKRNIKDTMETSTITTETTTETPSVTTETPADTTETILKIISKIQRSRQKKLQPYVA